MFAVKLLLSISKDFRKNAPSEKDSNWDDSKSEVDICTCYTVYEVSCHSHNIHNIHHFNLSNYFRFYFPHHYFNSNRLHYRIQLFEDEPSSFCCFVFYFLICRLQLFLMFSKIAGRTKNYEDFEDFHI